MEPSSADIDRARVLRISLLGPLEVLCNGRAVEVTPGRLRSLLCALALSANRTVSVDRLAEAVWGERLPNNTRRSLQTYVARLRAALGTDWIGTTPAGYELRVPAENVDALRFQALLDAAAKETDIAAERKLLVEALTLWRGLPMDGDSSAWRDRSGPTVLVERYLSAWERRTDLDLALGPPDGLAAELSELTRRYPLRESLWLRLLLVLQRLGRPAEALASYETIRVRLADELGVDPGPELQHTYAGLLAPPPEPVAGSEPAGPGRPEIPRQLPGAADGFTGRVESLGILDALLRRLEKPRTATVTAVVHGAAGVGKTTLAVHWAHTVREQFPDGQLYVNLRGFDPSGQPVEPAEAVSGFLEALGVAGQQMPEDLSARSGLYRGLLADKRALVVLDNARDENQVRPLLPAPGCVVLITSRGPLAGLVSAEGAEPVGLDMFTAEEARQFLATRIGHARVSAEPQALDEMVDLCAGLPLALSIVAARAAIRPDHSLVALASDLGSTSESLDGFAVGDVVTDLRMVFSWSYRTLGADAARLFRLLSLHPGPDISAVAAASLAGVPARRVRTLLAELVRTRLVEEPTPGRFGFHDLVRAYAAELRHVEDADLRVATLRMLDHYVHGAHDAARLLRPGQDAIRPPSGPGAIRVRLTDHRQALAWFSAEHGALVTLIRATADPAFDRHICQLASDMYAFLDWRGDWHSQVAVQRIGLEAALRLNDEPGLARAHVSLAHANTRLGGFDEAHHHLRQALDLYIRLGDSGGQARTHLNLTHVLEWQGQAREALHHAQEALELHRLSGNRVGQADALNEVGWAHDLLGSFEPAMEHCRQALHLYQELGHRHGEAAAWDSLGYAHHHLGNRIEAVRCYRRAIRIFQEFGDRYKEAESLARLGDAQEAGDLEAARSAWRTALTTLEDLHHPLADEVRSKLHP